MFLSPKGNDKKKTNFASARSIYIVFLDKVIEYVNRGNDASNAEEFSKAISAVSGVANVIGGQHVL